MHANNVARFSKRGTMMYPVKVIGLFLRARISPRKASRAHTTRNVELTTHLRAAHRRSVTQSHAFLSLHFKWARTNWQTANWESEKIGTGGIRTSAHSLVSSNELSNCATRVYSGRLVNLTVATLHSLECLSDQLYYTIQFVFRKKGQTK